jgi:molecular chaperone Hsp33
MKYDGILTTQMKGDGPFRVLISDFHKENKKLNGNIRGYASFDDIMKEGDSLQNMFGEDAYLAITIDQGSFMERYQGIVKLEGDTFTHAAEEYFRSSEQLPTKIVLACDQDEYGVWQACAIMIQHYARSAESEYLRDETKTKEDWNNSSILLSTIKKVELLDKKLSLQNLLIRLYHEAGLRVFDHTKVSANCRCSEDKIRTVLSSLNLKELKDVSEDGTVTVTCDFCKIDHEFKLSKLIDQV